MTCDAMNTLVSPWKSGQKLGRESSRQQRGGCACPVCGQSEAGGEGLGR